MRSAATLGVERRAGTTGGATHVTTSIDVVVESVKLVSTILWRRIDRNFLLIEFEIAEDISSDLYVVLVVDREVRRYEELHGKTTYKLGKVRGEKRAKKRTKLRT